MNKVSISCLLIVAGTMLAGTVTAADSTPGQNPGWTGVTSPKEVRAARLKLMLSIEGLMKPIDTITVEPVKDIEKLHSNAEAIAAMLLAFPHLFPPTTNRYDPKAQVPETLALPAIWSNFASFYALAGAAEKAAESMANAQGTGSLRAASRQLRASCDACHAVFVRKYVEPKVQDSDAQFDFDAALGGKSDRK